ncbi:MAG TPA: AAA family ATPase [Deltaproteobacteria bacterium]|nr:AAA family ATPase [Deltaproteobacteria bacterium]
MNIPYTIAITGKGGTGKTTIAASLIACLIKGGHAPVLAVDADPNSCLDQALNVRVKKTVGQIREESRDAGAGQPGGISKRELIELRIAECLVEADDFDLIAMGRPEGPGCYCYANSLFRDVIAELSKAYPFIVIDNEAGLENLSRRLYRKINLLVIAGDPSKRGIETVRRLYRLAKEMEIEYETLAVVINLVREGSMMEDPTGMIRDMGADCLVTLPFDDEIARAAETGQGIHTVQMSNPVLSGMKRFVSRLNLAGEKVRGKKSETG